VELMQWMLVKRLTRRVAVMATDLGVEKYLVSAHSEVLDASFLPKIGDPPEQWWGKAGEAVDQQPELAADSRPGGAERVPGADQSADIDEDMKYKFVRTDQRFIGGVALVQFDILCGLCPRTHGPFTIVLRRCEDDLQRGRVYRRQKVEHQAVE
jgi:hypothetical protein